MNFKHQLLIALPDIQDPRFKQALILICEHNKDGVMGLVLNNPMDISTDQVFHDLDLEQPSDNHAIFDGGPLNKNSGFVIHNNNDLYTSSINIQENLTLTTSKDMLTNISKDTITCPWKFILGYSGWDKNQLEEEIAENTWLTCPVDLDLIFNTKSTEQWSKALSIIGIDDYINISGAGHA